MRIKLIIISIVAMVVLWSSYRLLQSEHFWEWSITKFINSQHSDFVIKEISIDSMQVLLNGRISIHNMNIKGRMHGAMCFISFGSIEIQNVYAFLNLGKLTDVNITHGAIVSDVINGSDIKISAKVENIKGELKANGLIDMPTFEVHRYVLSNVQSPFSFDSNRLVLHEIKAGFYAGHIKSDLKFNLSPNLDFSFKVHLNDVDTILLSEINPAIFEQMKGIVSGDIHLSMINGVLKDFQMELQALQGGQMKATLLQYLAQYMPQRKEIERLINQGRDIALDTAHLNVNAIREDQFTATVIFNSLKLNLNVKVVFDVRMDNGINSLLNHFPQKSGSA